MSRLPRFPPAHLQLKICYLDFFSRKNFAFYSYNSFNANLRVGDAYPKKKSYTQLARDLFFEFFPRDLQRLKGNRGTLMRKNSHGFAYGGDFICKIDYKTMMAQKLRVTVNRKKK